MLGEQVRTLRLELGMTQEQVAAGIASRSYISDIEREKSVPTARLLSSLATRLQRSSHQHDRELETETLLLEAKFFAINGEVQLARESLQRAERHCGVSHLYAKQIALERTRMALLEKGQHSLMHYLEQLGNLIWAEAL